MNQVKTDRIDETGHQRRASLSVPSPLQAASAPAYSMPNAFASGFAAAAGIASPTRSSPPVYEHVLQGMPSEPLSPAMSSAHSGHLIAAAVGGAGAAAFGATSPAGSGHLYGSPLPGHAHAQTLSSQLGHTVTAQHYQVASPRQQVRAPGAQQCVMSHDGGLIGIASCPLMIALWFLLGFFV